jgi:hypothetical protein
VVDAGRHAANGPAGGALQQDELGLEASLAGDAVLTLRLGQDALQS